MLSLDLADAVELVDQSVPHPPFPETPQRLGRWFFQGDVARLRQRELRAVGLGQLGGLYQQWPSECLDGSGHLLPTLRLLLGWIEEITPVQHLGDSLHGRRRSPPRLRAHGDATAIDQAQHREQVSWRRAFHLAADQLDSIAGRFRAFREIAFPGPFDRLGQLVPRGECHLRGWRHECKQTLCQVARDDRRRVRVTVCGVKKEPQRCAPAGGVAAPARGQGAVLGLEPVGIESAVHAVQHFAHSEFLTLVELVPETPERLAGQTAFDRFDHLRLSSGPRPWCRQQLHHGPENVARQRLQGPGQCRSPRVVNAIHRKISLRSRSPISPFRPTRVPGHQSASYRWSAAPGWRRTATYPTVKQRCNPAPSG